MISNKVHVLRDIFLYVALFQKIYSFSIGDDLFMLRANIDILKELNEVSY